MGVALTIVLSNANKPDGSISEDSKRRVERAVELFKSGKTSRILMSGGWSFLLESRPEITEAENMRLYAISLGVPESAILVEEKSMDTTGNAMYCRELVDNLLDISEIILVTSDYHMERAGYLFGKAFGNVYELSFAEAPSDMSNDKRIARQESEKRTTDLMHFLYDKVDDGDYTNFRDTVLRTHPPYGKDPSTIPEKVWEGFERGGITREFLIAKFMKTKSKSA